MKQISSSGANRSSASQGIPRILHGLNVYYMFTGFRHLSLPRATWNQHMRSHPITLETI